MITINVHNHVDTTAILQKLEAIETQNTLILQQGRKILMANAEVQQVLDQINEHTNRLATAITAVGGAQEVQGTKLAEVASDVDELLTLVGSDPDLKLRLESIRDRVSEAATKAEEAASVATATGEALTQVAAKYDAPVPVDPEG